MYKELETLNLDRIYINYSSIIRTATHSSNFSEDAFDQFYELKQRRTREDLQVKDVNEFKVFLNYVGGYDGMTAIIKGMNKKCACNMEQVDEKIVQLESGFNTQLMI